MTELEKEFEWVRKNYFPRWDKEKEWKIKFLKDADVDLDDKTDIKHHNLGGFCSVKEKTIYVNDPSRLTVIHEVAHAVAPGSHGKKWLNRMEKAAEKAIDLEDIELSKSLRQEVEMYSKSSPKEGFKNIFNTIETWTMESPDLSFEEIVTAVASAHELKPDYLLKHRQSRKVYNEAKKHIENRKLLRAKMIKDGFLK